MIIITIIIINNDNMHVTSSYSLHDSIIPRASEVIRGARVRAYDDRAWRRSIGHLT